MKIKFTQKIKLFTIDYNWGDEYLKTFEKDQVVEVLAIQDNTHGYKDIHFAHKEVAEGVDESAFVIL
jgi:hypothetical protein